MADQGRYLPLRILEPLILFVSLIVLNWGLYRIIGPVSPWIARHATVLNTALFLYLPLIPLGRKGENRLDADQYGLSIGEIPRSTLLFLITFSIVAPLFTLGFYLVSVVGFPAFHPRFQPHVLDDFLGHALFQFFHVALPEEFFFRGYVQTRFDQLFRGRVRVLGAPVGWGLPVASAFFALAHPLLGTGWANLDTFFPGLLFGWLKSRRNSLAAPVLMHWSANLLLFSLT